MKISKGKALKTQVNIDGKLYHIVFAKFAKTGHTMVITDEGEIIQNGYPPQFWETILRL